MWTAKTLISLIWVFAGRTCHFVGFVMRWLNFGETLKVKHCYPEVQHHQHHKSHVMRLWYFSSSVNSILQTRMRTHPVGLDIWFLVRPFVYFHTSCVQTAKALARISLRAGSHEPSLVIYVISTIISWAGSITLPTSRHIAECHITSWASAWQNKQMPCVPSENRSAWASAQSDQSSLSAWRKLGSLTTH